ncbi:MAG: hypothetical protein L6Q92_13610 [Phycisphaerae bacterium]|nr:hypothetical protein [Phycisphaerae bacterium]
MIAACEPEALQDMAKVAAPSQTKQRIMLAGSLAALLIAGGLVWYSFGGETPLRQANERVFMCAETGKTFFHELESGEIEPIYSPHSKQNTGWIAEPCYWTNDGRAKKEPTWVIERRRMGLEGKTYCPDCGREVVGHNPRPPKELMDAAE